MLIVITKMIHNDKDSDADFPHTFLFKRDSFASSLPYLLPPPLPRDYRTISDDDGNDGDGGNDGDISDDDDDFS